MHSLRSFARGPLSFVPLLAVLVFGVGCSEATDPTSPASVAVARRVVSLAPSITETLYALGADDVLIAVTSRCDRPPAAKRKPHVGDVTQLSLEQIAGLEPDLILVNSVTHVEMLRPLAERVRVTFVPTDNIEQVRDGVTVIGDAVGRPAAGQALRLRLERELAARRAAAADHAGTRVLFVIQRDPFFIAGPGSYVDGLLRALGYRNAADRLGQPWPNVSAEALLEMAPDVLVDAAIGEDDTADPLAYWSRFESLPAVKNGRVRLLQDDVVVRPGPALAEALDVLERSIEGAPPPEPGGGGE